MSLTPKNFYKKLLGKTGEDLAVKYLKKSGYRLVKRNYTTPFGEADIIAIKGGVTVFVEVKTRTNNTFGEPKEAVGYQKQEKYRKIANYYMQRYGETEIGFAVAEVMDKKVNLITDAF